MSAAWFDVASYPSSSSSSPLSSSSSSSSCSFIAFSAQNAPNVIWRPDPLGELKIALPDSLSVAGKSGNKEKGRVDESREKRGRKGERKRKGWRKGEAAHP